MTIYADLQANEVPLPFKVFLKTTDGEWTLKAAFATDRLAGAYLLGILSIPGNDGKIFVDREGELWEVTEEAMNLAAAAIREARAKKPALSEMLPLADLSARKAYPKDETRPFKESGENLHNCPELGTRGNIYRCVDCGMVMEELIFEGPNDGLKGRPRRVEWVVLKPGKTGVHIQA